jgi:hypothetical protein
MQASTLEVSCGTALWWWRCLVNIPCLLHYLWLAALQVRLRTTCFALVFVDENATLGLLQSFICCWCLESHSRWTSRQQMIRQQVDVEIGSLRDKQRTYMIKCLLCVSKQVIVGV